MPNYHRPNGSLNMRHQNLTFNYSSGPPPNQGYFPPRNNFASSNYHQPIPGFPSNSMPPPHFPPNRMPFGGGGEYVFAQPPPPTQPCYQPTSSLPLHFNQQYQQQPPCLPFTSPTFSQSGNSRFHPPSGQQQQQPHLHQNSANKSNSRRLDRPYVDRALTDPWQDVEPKKAPCVGRLVTAPVAQRHTVLFAPRSNDSSNKRGGDCLDNDGHDDQIEPKRQST